MRKSNPTLRPLLASPLAPLRTGLQTVLWAVLALCLGNAWGSRTVDPLDLPKAERPILSESAEDAGYYFNARFYDGERGSFIGRDPKEQYFSPYMNCANNALACTDIDGRAGERRLWKLMEIGDALKWGRNGTVMIYESAKTDRLGRNLWWAKDLDKHGGSFWKVFEKKSDGLHWIADADEFGDFIPAKHKGESGLFIPNKELSGVNRKPAGGIGYGLLGLLGALLDPESWILDNGPSITAPENHLDFDGVTPSMQVQDRLMQNLNTSNLTPISSTASGDEK